jgi:hypothetical protein
MAQRQLSSNFRRQKYYRRTWDTRAIRDQMFNDQVSWWKNINAMKKESARNFDNQLHNLRSIWPRLDENNEPILTYQPISDDLKKSTLIRDFWTCRLCCRSMFYCIGEGSTDESWYSRPSIKLEVHHIIPQPAGPNTFDNLMVLCKQCHELLQHCLDRSLKDRAVFDVVLYSFHKCLNEVPKTFSLPYYYSAIAKDILSYLKSQNPEEQDVCV